MCTSEFAKRGVLMLSVLTTNQNPNTTTTKKGTQENCEVSITVIVGMVSWVFICPNSPNCTHCVCAVLCDSNYTSVKCCFFKEWISCLKDRKKSVFQNSPQKEKEPEMFCILASDPITKKLSGISLPSAKLICSGSYGLRGLFLGGGASKFRKFTLIQNFVYMLFFFYF